MRKSKAASKKKRVQPTRRSKPRATPARKPSSVSRMSEEYTEYLERYEMYGEDRPRLSPAEFNRLDDELLDLLARAEEGALSDDEVIRLNELEFLLLDEQSDSTRF